MADVSLSLDYIRIGAVVGPNNDITLEAAALADIRLEGLTDITLPGDSLFTQVIESGQADLSLETLAPDVSASQCEITVEIADVSLEGLAPGITRSKIFTLLLGVAAYAPAANMNLERIAPSFIGYSVESATPADLSLEGIAPTFLGFGVESATPAELELDASDGGYPIFSIPSGLLYSVVFRCTLTGSADNTTNLILPISSFQTRLRDGTPTYLGVVVPNAVLYSADIAARSNGQIVVEKGAKFSDGTIMYSELARVDFESIAYDTGPNNSSNQLSGHITESNTNIKTVALNGVSLESLQTDGLRRVRCEVDFFARPGDTVTWESGVETMTAGLITITVSTSQAYMDITEASA